MHREIQVDKDFTFTFKFYDLGVQSVPSSATVSIFNNSGTSLQTGAGTIDSDGTITFIFLEANNDDDERNFKVQVEYVVSTVTKFHFELFDVVVTPLTNNVRDEDLFVYMESLRGTLFTADFLTSSDGTTSTLISTDFLKDQRDWKGGLVQIFISNTITHEARITAFSRSTNTITFTPAYIAVIAMTKEFRIRDSYQTIINKAYDQHVVQDIRNKVGVAAGYIDGNVVTNMITFKALRMICAGRVEDEGDKWALLRDDNDGLYKDEYSKLKEPFDTDEDGNIDGREDVERPNMGSRSVIR